VAVTDWQYRGQGDQGEIDARGPWNEGEQWEFVQAPARAFEHQEGFCIIPKALSFKVFQRHNNHGRPKFPPGPLHRGPLSMLDCLIIGGGPAGLTAANYLARYRRRALVVDDQASRAALIPASHNYSRV
jgi:hypothetical protein